MKLFKKLIIAFISLLLVFLCSCQSENVSIEAVSNNETISKEENNISNEENGSSENNISGEDEMMNNSKELTYEQITQEEAKKIIDSETDYIILDVRTAEEFAEGHIENAVLLDYTDIQTKAEIVIPEKDKLILVYCRSGRRSKIAADELVKLGYSNVKEFGGIIDWKYEIVK